MSSEYVLLYVMGYVILALVILVILTSFYKLRRLLIRNKSLVVQDYYEEKHWDEPEELRFDTRSPQEIKEYSEMREWGMLNPTYTCPHCHKKGFVRTKSVRRKKDIDAARETGVVLMGGWSLVATGLTQEAERTQVHCGNCGSTWDV